MHARPAYQDRQMADDEEWDMEAELEREQAMELERPLESQQPPEMDEPEPDFFFPNAGASAWPSRRPMGRRWTVWHLPRRPR